MLEPGGMFDRYTIEALLGEGGMGRVYRALDSRLHRRVALKILSVEAATTPDLRSEGVARRASSEIDVTGPTQGQQIPTITGKGVVIGTPVYMSPEQMRGLPVDGRSDQFAWG